jgi:large subunit ribosomal protein L10
MVILTKKLPEWKITQIDDTAHRMMNAKTIAIVDIKGMPASQFHDLRSKLRSKMDIFVRKKTVIKFALEKAKTHHKDIEKIQETLGEMPALILSNLNPFQISKLFADNKAQTFAKAGDIAPEDIIVDEGPTPFTPGPMISELSAVGLKVKVEAGKIVVMAKSTIVKVGEKIKPQVADILVKLGIQPMQIGLAMKCAWENNFVFGEEVLRFDTQQYLHNLSAAASGAFRLSIGLPYPTKDNIAIIVSKLYNEAKALALERNIMADAVVPQLLAKATAQAGALDKYAAAHKPAAA